MRGSSASTALVVVHPSSIDSYAWEATASGAAELAEELLFNIAMTVREHDGPVIWIDQGFDDRLIRTLRREVEGAPLVEIRFDETEQPWSSLWPRLRRALQSRGVTDTLVAGIWWEPQQDSGCAFNVYKWLDKNGFRPVAIRDSLGSMEDLEPRDDEDEDEDE